MLGKENQIPRPKYLNKEKMKAIFPYLKHNQYGWLTYELAVDNKRFLLNAILTCTQDNFIAEMKGITLGNYLSLIKIEENHIIPSNLNLEKNLKNREKEVSGFTITLRDKISGKEIQTKSKVIVILKKPELNNRVILELNSSSIDKPKDCLNLNLNLKFQTGTENNFGIIPKFNMPGENPIYFISKNGKQLNPELVKKFIRIDFNSKDRKSVV